MLNGKIKFKSKIAECCITVAAVLVACQLIAKLIGIGFSLSAWLIIILLGGLGYIIETSTSKNRRN